MSNSKSIFSAYKPLLLTLLLLFLISSFSYAADNPAWDEDTVYTGGDRVTHNGSTWEAKWWTLGNEPGTTGEWGVWKLVESGPDPTVPATPTGLLAAAESTSEIKISWDSATDATAYDLEVDGEVITNVTSPYSHTGLKEGSSHNYKVRAKNQAGKSAWSNLVTATTEVITPTVPEVPKNLTARGISDTEITVSWSAVTNAAAYDLKVDGEIVNDVSSPYKDQQLVKGSTHSYQVRAKNDVGISDWSQEVTATASNTSNLPQKIMVGYWHTWGGDASGGVPFVKLRDVNPNWDVINVSFAEPVNPGSTDGDMQFEIAGLSEDYTKADFKADIKLLQSQGKKVVLSIGGYVGYFSLLSDSAINTFVSDIKSFVDEYGFDGIDIDLEQSSVELEAGDKDFRNPTSPKVVNMIKAIRKICDSYSEDFILSWAPETYYLQMGYQYYAGLNDYVDRRAGVYIPMIHALRDRTDYVHAQLYNSIVIKGLDGKTYSMGNSDAIVAMCEMLLKGFPVNGNSDYFFEPLRADQVVIAVPASAGAAGSGQISNAGLQQAFSTLIKDYPDLRGIMTWSINWDAFQNNNSFVEENSAYLDSLD